MSNIDNDKKEILEHIHSIFQAFLNQDRQILRETHAENWIGFLGPSTSIERGIEAYMANAEKSLQNFKGTGYEIIENEIQIYGDMALVYYVARYDYEDLGGHAHSLPLRSIDIYRRENDSWIQAGSHISVIPTGGGWGEGDKK